MAVFSDKFELAAFIVSTGRTGTMALAHHFNSNFDHVEARHEPPPSRKLRIASNRHLYGRLSKNDLAQLYRKSRVRMFRQLSCRVYIESNNFIHGFLDVLDALFDAPRIVHVVRDPRTYIPSHINHGVFRGIKGLAVKYHPYWMLKPEKYDGRAAKRWSTMSQVERLAWYWAVLNAELSRGAELFQERYLRIRFEDMISKDSDTLKRLHQFLCLPARTELARGRNGEKLNASRGPGFPSWHNWSHDAQQAVWSHCGTLMESFGYDVSASAVAAQAP